MLWEVDKGCTESIQPFWISRELVAWPWYNLAASRRRRYCVSVNSHFPGGASQSAVRRHWLTLCILSDRRINSDRARSASSRQCTCPFCSSRAGFFLAKYHITQVCQPLPTAQIYLPATSDFSIAKSPLKGRRFVNVTVQQYKRSINGVSLPTV